jgi:hypothetical protein
MEPQLSIFKPSGQLGGSENAIKHTEKDEAAVKAAPIRD